MEWINDIQYNELICKKNNNPHALLGLHRVGRAQVILVYRPCAWTVYITDAKGENSLELLKLTEEGLFGAWVTGSTYSNYNVRVVYGENDVVEMKDPYCFKPQIGELDRHLFAAGNHYQIYEKLGAHPMKIDGVEGTLFAVWAPNARSVSVVGDFNMWDGRLHPMRQLEVSGIYELFIPGVVEGATYKYLIHTRDEKELYKADPYANSAEVRPSTASVVADINKFKWSDGRYRLSRDKKNRELWKRQPMAIYEVHPGSWKKKDDGTEDGFYNYRELAEELASYVKEMGYTHVELMGILEHPFDGSWGYQVTGYYAPTSRYGTPEDFMYFINYMHKNKIGVILDWVPAHFPKDEHGLARFDGQPLYEYPDPRKGEHPHWGTLIFNYEKKEVANFLIANALYWIEKFHIDGLRVDAVASMLYLDYGKEDGQWIPNKDGGTENLEVIEFLKHMSSILEERNPAALLIAEESTAWPMVSKAAKDGGLGFHFKWNMGWMNDFLEYMKLDPYFRSFNHNKLVFSMMYAYSENFIQALSHDEVVHMKGSLINKMPGYYEDKFANLRLAYGFMYGHPGKKLLFMGQEFAQWREWSEARSLDWNLLEEDANKKMQDFVKQLNALYAKYDAFYYNDTENIGFEWLSCDDNERSIVAFIRRGSTAKQQLMFVCNFTPVMVENYRVGVPCKGAYTPILNSDDVKFGGGGRAVNKLTAEQIPCLGRDYSVSFDLPPLSVVAFRYNYTE
ncbi:MAG: 1,4-alpha-glucan branching protein GlgB [Lachnospiraceae bacterium]|nr:1,4-alpha-glucan branching protein GlgB [Lachnospiraceae bacterium]